MKSERRDRGANRGAHPEGPLEHALAAEARDGRIGCATVFRVAAAQGVPAVEAGRAVQRLGIKITGCQLGCFP